MKKIIILNLLISTLYSQIVWGPDIKISPPQDSLNEYHPRAIAWKDTIHLVYYALHHSQYDIFYMRSTDKGETWEGPINLTINDPDDAVLPWITCWGKKVHVVYFDSDSIMYTRSIDGGNTWAGPITLIKPGGYPIIGCRRDTIFAIAPAQGFDNRLWLRKSYDGGNTWSPQEVIDSFFTAKRIYFSFNYVHLCGGKRQTSEVFYFRSPDLGNTWEGPFLISPLDNWASQFPSLAVSDSNVYITWDESLNSPYPWTGDIYLRKSHDNGNSFEPYQDLTNFYRARESDIYAKDSIVVVVWEDERHNPGQSDFEIYWRASYDYGNTWTDEERLTYGGGNTEWPCITGWGNEVYLFWIDSRTDSVEVFFKKGIYTNIKETHYLKEKDSEFLSSNILFLPAKIRFYVRKGEEYKLSLYNLDGKEILKIKRGVSKGKEEVIFSNTKEGSYFLVLQTKGKILKRKILILEGGER